MKKLLISVICLIIEISTIQAGRPHELSGTVENNLYKDKKYNFSLKLNDQWKYTLQKNEENYRLLLTQRNYDIPPDYVNAPDYTLIPRIVLWTDTTSLHPFAFLDSLVSNTWQTEQKKELFKEFEILNPVASSGANRESTIPRGRKSVEIGGEQGVVWQGKSKYMKEVSTSASSLAGVRVYGAYGGAIIAVKHENRIYVFHLMTEWAFFDAVLQQAINIIGTLTFEGAPKQEKAPDSKG